MILIIMINIVLEQSQPVSPAVRAVPYLDSLSIWTTVPEGESCFQITVQTRASPAQNLSWVSVPPDYKDEAGIPQLPICPSAPGTHTALSHVRPGASLQVLGASDAVPAPPLPSRTPRPCLHCLSLCLAARSSWPSQGLEGPRRQCDADQKSHNSPSHIEDRLSPTPDTNLESHALWRVDRASLCIL